MASRDNAMQADDAPDAAEMFKEGRMTLGSPFESVNLLSACSAELAELADWIDVPALPPFGGDSPPRRVHWHQRVKLRPSLHAPKHTEATALLSKLTFQTLDGPHS
jgi:hypothetical protein